MPDAGYVLEMERLAQEAADPRLVEVDGVTFVAGKVTDVRKKDPVPEPIVLATLESLAGYVEENRDGIDLGTAVLHVESPTVVRLYGKLEGYYQQRFEYAVARAVVPEGFEFGRFYDPEAFVIALQALFVDDLDRADVLRVVGTIRDEEVTTSKDDGITQEVTAAAGLVLVDRTNLPNPVLLRPYRTFREIVQPESPFVLRARSGKTVGSTPTFALFEADGGLWRLDAVNNVKDWLDRKTLEPRILG